MATTTDEVSQTILTVTDFFDPKNVLIPPSQLRIVMTPKAIQTCMKILSIFYKANNTATGLYHDVAMYKPDPCLPGFTSPSDFHHKLMDVLCAYSAIVQIERRKRRRAAHANQMIIPEKIPPHPFWQACAAIRKIMLRHNSGFGEIQQQFVLPNTTMKWFYGTGDHDSGKRRAEQILLWRQSGIIIHNDSKMIVPSTVVENFLYQVSCVEMIRTQGESREFDQQAFCNTIMSKSYAEDFMAQVRATHASLKKQSDKSKTPDKVYKIIFRMVEIIVNTSLAGITKYEAAGQLPGGGVRFRHKCEVIAEDQDKKETRKSSSKHARSKSSKSKRGSDELVKIENKHD